MKKRIVLRLEGGLVQGIAETSEGLECIQIQVRDYDTDGMDFEELHEDSEGRMYWEYNL